MNLGALLSVVGLAAVKAEAKATARRMGRQAAVAGVTALLLLAAIGLALAALTVWLAGEVGTIWALLIVAGGLVVIAAIVQIAVRLADGRRPSRRPFVAPPPPPMGDPLRGAGVEEPPAGSALGAVAAVAVVGFLLARQLLRK